jgi:hypothetical protein
MYLLMPRVKEELAKYLAFTQKVDQGVPPEDAE